MHFNILQKEKEEERLHLVHMSLPHLRSCLAEHVFRMQVQCSPLLLSDDTPLPEVAHILRVAANLAYSAWIIWMHEEYSRWVPNSRCTNAFPANRHCVGLAAPEHRGALYAVRGTGLHIS